MQFLDNLHTKVKYTKVKLSLTNSYNTGSNQGEIWYTLAIRYRMPVSDLAYRRARITQHTTMQNVRIVELGHKNT